MPPPAASPPTPQKLIERDRAAKGRPKRPTPENEDESAPPSVPLRATDEETAAVEARVAVAVEAAAAETAAEAAATSRPSASVGGAEQVPRWSW